MGEVSKSEDLWNPYRELYDIVSKSLSSANTNPCAFNELETVLRRNKQSFFSLLHNLPKNTKSRDELKKGMEDGITVKGIGHQILSRELYQEAIIVSDMFELNEFIALDLLCTAQMQMPYYVGLPRGLVAIALYYEGRKYLITTLRILIQARSGTTWSTDLPKQMQMFIDTYTNQLIENGLFNKIFELLKTLDLAKEMEKLQANLALGGPKHRKQITDSFTSIRIMLAECVFYWSKQSGLPSKVTVSLINYLKEVKLDQEASGKLDTVTLYLLMSLLNALDLSVLHSREDGEEFIQKLPILSEKDFVSNVLKELEPSKSWACQGLQSMAIFGFAVCLSSLRLVPQGQQIQNVMDYEDEFIDAAIVMKVFEFMTHIMMENELFYTEELIYKRMHYLFCDFIVQMYPKVKELRIKADETARTIQAYLHEGLELPPNIPRYFENMLLAVAKMYEKDTLQLQLMLDYWIPSDNLPNSTNYRTHPRFVSLFKFVRLAGDMLPPSLFVSYLTMLSSLAGCQQSARNCFNMLKTTSGLNNNLNWDHFFMSFNQYYSNLKQEASSGHEIVYRHSRVYHKGIVPQEIEGLHAVLKLISAIAEHDDFSRLALCEHPGWAPLTVLLGLVSCSIPIPLKADLLKVLASLCKSSETASQMWNNLEASQILVTIPTTSSYQPRGIQTELDEVESRIEEYPLTRSWLTLLDVLTDFGIPRSLGAGPRLPGFDPYLSFTVNSIFLKFNSRNYKNSAEKWQIAALCLKLFAKFVEQYEPEASDFPTSGKPNEFNPPPGFHLMLQLHTKSELFDGLMFVISEGNRLYDTYFTHFAGAKYIDECTLHTFRILHRCLILENRFFQLLSSSNCPPMLLKKLNEILLTNSRTGRPDHILNIMKYLSYHDEVPKQSLLSVKILTLVTASPKTHTILMNILLSSSDVDKEIRNGFVECLGQNSGNLEISIATKKAILIVLNHCLQFNAPNLSHFLFGFDVGAVTKTVFQLPGVLNFPRTCMHSLISILRQEIYEGNEVDPSLLESSYHMLYSLCSNSKTAEPTLRFIRAQPNFFKDHINHCFNHYNDGILQLNQLSWILKTLAIELRLACSGKQLVNLKQLSALLVGIPTEISIQADAFAIIQKNSEPTIDDISFSLEKLKHDNLLIKLISEFDFSVPEVIAPQWGFFEESSLDAYLAACQTEQNPKLIDIKKLHRNLIDEVTQVQGAAAIGQRQAMMDEIQKVLLHALNINNNRKTALSITKFVDAWRQVTQVLITYLPPDIISIKEQVLLELYLLESILKKAVKVAILPEVGNYLSGTVAILLENLRKCHIKEERLNKVLARETEQVHKSMLQMNMSSMKSILNCIVEWLIVSDNKSQKIRINLYGALTIFLQLISITENYTNTQVNDSLYVSRLDSSKYRIQDEISTIYLSNSILSSFSEKLIEILCYDCTGAHEICKMLALTCFGLLLGITNNVNWITFLSGRGYLKHIIDSVLKSDEDLRGALEPTPDNKQLRSIYLYDVKMAFFLRIANTNLGAELLIEHHFLSVLASINVYNFHPELTKHLRTEQDDYITPVEGRYLQIWEPTLHLCNSILTSVGTDNKAAVQQIMCFLLSHLDVVELVLRSGVVTLTVHGLKELSLLTSVIARTANNDLINVLSSTTIPQDNRAHIYRLQKLMLALIPRFILLENTLKELLSDSFYNEEISFQTSERLSYAIEINANLMLYSRNIIENHGIEHDSVGIVFQPNLNDALIGINRNQQTKNYTEYVPSLGVIVYNLINTISYYHKEKPTMDYLNRKLTEIPDLGTLDLKEFVKHKNVEVGVMREEALKLITDRESMKKNDIQHCMLIIEHSMYIIWAHLDYYMRKAIPKVSNFGQNVSTFNLNTTLASSMEAVWKVSAEDISNLKQGLVSIFNDSFCRQLLETSEARAIHETGFLEVLLREIKRLIQFVPVK